MVVAAQTAVADIEAVQVASQPEPEPLPELEQLSYPTSEAVQVAPQPEAESLSDMGQLSDPAAEDGANGSALSTAALEDMTVAELRAELKARGLKVSGKKSELIERLQSGV